MDPILEIDNLSISFFTRAGEIPSVMDFSCRVMPGQAMGLVGESGCGKSTTGRCIMRLIEPSSGEIWFQGRDVTSLDGVTQVVSHGEPTLKMLAVNRLDDSFSASAALAGRDLFLRGERFLYCITKK